MKTYQLKDSAHFGLYGSDALSEPGFHRFTEAERTRLKPENPDAAWHSLCSTGIVAKFRTDAKEIIVHVKLLLPPNMDNMSAIGQSGIDLYFYHEEMAEYCLLDVSRFDFHQAEYDVSIGRFHDGLHRDYLLNLPLYMGATEITMSFNDEATIIPVGFSHPGRIAIYGTSIVQGGCVSRPGMLFSNILSRWLDKEILNFGFSGAAFSEKTTASILSTRQELDLLIIDIEANAGCSDLMEKRLPGFIDEFRKAYPLLPIILVSRSAMSMDLYDANRIGLRTYYDRWLRKLTASYRKQKQNVTYLDGFSSFSGNFTEYTVDGIHPSDLGALAIAKAYLRQIRKILNH